MSEMASLSVDNSRRKICPWRIVLDAYVTPAASALVRLAHQIPQAHPPLQHLAPISVLALDWLSKAQ